MPAQVVTEADVVLTMDYTEFAQMIMCAYPDHFQNPDSVDLVLINTNPTVGEAGEVVIQLMTVESKVIHS